MGVVVEVGSGKSVEARIVMGVAIEVAIEFVIEVAIEVATITIRQGS